MVDLFNVIKAGVVALLAIVFKETTVREFGTDYSPDAWKSFVTATFQA